MLSRLTARLALVGADPRDDEDLRARKGLLVLISVLILPIAAIWGGLYLAFRSPVGIVPLVYLAVLLGAIVMFSRTGDFARLLRISQVDILLAPTLSMHPSGRWSSRTSARPPAGTPPGSSSSWDRVSQVSSSARSGIRPRTGSRARCWR
jgi:hypothetical protein